jgi:DNA-directed RNA polymerase specialized sigma24 family protein
LHQRQVVVLHYVADLPVNVIAAECGESVGP